MTGLSCQARRRLRWRACRITVTPVRDRAGSRGRIGGGDSAHLVRSYARALSWFASAAAAMGTGASSAEIHPARLSGRNEGCHYPAGRRAFRVVRAVTFRGSASTPTSNDEGDGLTAWACRGSTAGECDERTGYGAPVVGSPVMPQRYREIRAFTEQLAAYLSDEDQCAHRCRMPARRNGTGAHNVVLRTVRAVPVPAGLSRVRQRFRLSVQFLL